MNADWMKAETMKRLPQWQSTSQQIKPVLLAIPQQETAVIGWYFGEPMNEWRMNGSPTKQHPTHWTPLPQLP